MAKPRKGKSGAERIAEILDDPVDSLIKDMTTLGKGFYASEKKNPEATPSQATLRALRSVRGHYQGMARRIDGISTGRKDAKKDVLDALKRFDSGLSAFGKALPAQATKGGEAKLAAAARKSQRASADLERARAKLT